MLLLVCLYCLQGGVRPFGLLFFSWCTYGSLSYPSLCLLTNPVPAKPWLSWPNSYTASQQPFTTPCLPVFSSTTWAFSSCSPVSPTGLSSVMLVSCLPFLTSSTWGQSIYSLKIASLQICHLPCPLIESQGVLLTKSLKCWKLAFLKLAKSKHPDFTLCLSSIPQGCERNHYMVTTVQAAFNPDFTNQFACVGEQQVQYYIPPAGAVYCLA